MKRVNKWFSLLLVLCMLISMLPAAVFAAATPSVLYLKPNGNWRADNARFAAYFFGSKGYTWVDMTDSNGDGFYEVSVPDGYASVIFCRMNPTTKTNVWDNKWDQTADLTIPTDGKNCWILTEGLWDGSGAWSVYSSKVEYYLFGFIDGANYGCEEDSANMGSYKFVDGKLTATFKSDSYVAVKTSNNGKWYMTEGFDKSAASVTLYDTAVGIAEPDKMFVPGGVTVEFTLKVNLDGTLTLSYVVDQNSCAHRTHDAQAVCTTCGKYMGHTYSEGVCIVCGQICSHSWVEGTCSDCSLVCAHEAHSTEGQCEDCGLTVAHSYSDGSCDVCGLACRHVSHDVGGVCDICHDVVAHSYSDGVCSVCGNSCDHDWVNGGCSVCGATCGHSYVQGSCTVCGQICGHDWDNGICTTCGSDCSHDWDDGVCGICGKACVHSWSGGICTDCGAAFDGIKIHFVDTLGWKVVCAYPWVISGDASAPVKGFGWPGQAVGRDADGYYTLELDAALVSGGDLGILFHNFEGTQTADVIISSSTLKTQKEFWIKPGTTVNTEGKYPCSTATAESGLLISPEINGNQVTFRYQSSTASAVYLAGSFNNWSTTANKLAKGNNGIFSITMTLEPGVYEYKFVVDGKWVTDSSNGQVGGFDGNSLVAVGPAGDSTDSTITVKLHFYRTDGNYTGWDLWMWPNGGNGAAYALQDDPMGKGKVATITVDGKSTTALNYIVRKTDWSEREFSDRSIDLSDVASGTVHFYLNSGSETGSRVLGADVIRGTKVVYANLDYDKGKIWVKTSLPVSGRLADAFSVVDPSGNPTDITVTNVVLENNGYALTLSQELDVHQVGDYRIRYGESLCAIATDGLFYSDRFEQDYTYDGNDLGAIWSETSTTFKVWAPTAKAVSVKLYESGNYAAKDLLSTVAMTRGEKGVWMVTVPGNLNGKYYNYSVTFSTYTVEATDPYAKSTGANGDRGMILNLDSTDPAGWSQDISPNQGMSYTDAIIYELHVREYTIDSSSGVKDEWKGKYLGLTQTGTSYSGYATGLDHLKELGITHVQLMPVYDYNYGDEYHANDWNQYAWGYDPKNYNVPEGLYSTDPFDGSVRVAEFKEMVQTFHENGINVVMDVVYNHAFDGGNFCYNKIVPNYFSRFYGEGNWSNGSGCGNDIATERSMTRNYIVDSILHWVEEYHVDGFRFDLAGLIDTQTINEIADAVHEKYPYVMLYGEGWSSGATAVEDGYSLTTQGNAYAVPEFSFFNDGIRNAIAGDNGNSWGFASGAGDKADAIANYFRASNGWSTTPTQAINYVSCHDNYSLMDKLCISRNGAYWSELARMNNLSAAIYMMAQGTPFIYSGEEVLREKKDAKGNRYDNAYGTDDYINKIRWSDLVSKEYANVANDYYAGLVEFRKNHAALRCPDGTSAWWNVTYHKISEQVILFYIGGDANGEVSDGICIIYNASNTTQWVDLYDKIPAGNWQACVHGQQAGIDSLWSVNVTGSAGNVGVEGISTTILVKGDLVDEDSVYVRNQGLTACAHPSHGQDGKCTTCGAAVDHSYTSKVTAPTCAKEGYTTYTCSVCKHSYTGNTVAATGEHDYVNGSCSVCGQAKPVVKPTLTVTSIGLSLKDEVIYNVYFSASDISDVVEMGLLGFNTQNENGTISNADYVTPGYTTSGQYYVAHSNGIPAKNLGDDYYYMAYAKLSDGTYAYSPMKSYNAVKYANTILGNASSNAKLKAVVVAMLNYGAAAQVQFDYKTDALMNAGLTAEQKALVKAYDESMVNDVLSVDSTKAGEFATKYASARSVGISLKGAFAINYYLTASKAVDSGMTLYYWTEADYKAASTLTTANATGSVVMDATGTANQFKAAVEGISAKRIDETIFVVGVYESNGVTYSTGVLAYSLGKYCEQQAAGSNAALAAMAQATAVYGYYAKAYFGN